MTQDQAQALVTRLLGTRNDMRMHPFEHGWVAEEILPAEDRARGMHVGQGCYVIDRTGVITVHPSLPVPMIQAEYSTARRLGRITGYRVWPEPIGGQVG